MYSKNWFIENENLLERQSKKYIIYLIFKNQELVYIGVTNDFIRRIHNEHFNKGYREKEPTKVLYQAIDKYGTDSFDVLKYAEYDDKNEAFAAELRLIKKFKLFNLARYNIVQSYDFIESMIDIRNKNNKKTDFLIGVNELSIAMDKIHNNLTSNTISNVIDKSNENLYFLLSTKIKDDNVAFKKDKRKVLNDKELSQYNFIYLEEKEDEEEEEEKMRGGYEIDVYPSKRRDAGKWYRIMKLLKSKTVNRRFYSEWYEPAEKVIDYIYDYATPLEQYIFVLSLSKKNEEDICEFLLIDIYDYNQAVSNIVRQLYSLERSNIPWGDNRYV